MTRRMRQTAPRYVHVLCLLLLCTVPWIAHAGVTLQVDGVKGDLQHGVVASVALSEYKNRDVTAAQIHRLYDKSLTEAKNALKPYGYYHARVDGNLTRQGKNWTVQLHVHPGKPVRISRVDIQVPSRAASLPRVKKAIDAFKPAKGQVLNDPTYTSSRDAIGAALTAVGFLDARMTVHKVAVTRADNSAVVHLKWVPGPRYRFGQVTFQGSQFHKGFLRRYVPFKKGDYFDQDQLLALQQALVGADYFSVVDVHPEVPQARKSTSNTVDIVVQLQPAPRNIYTGGPFIGTDTGFGVQGGVKQRWINRYGHTLNNQLVLAQRLKTLTTLYKIPLAGGHHKSLDFGAKLRDANTDTSKSRTIQLVASESQEWHGWLRTVGVHALIGTFTVGNHGNRNTNLPGIEHGSSHLVYPQISLSRKHGSDVNFLRHGWSIDLVARASPGSVLSSTHFAQLQAHAKWIDAFTRWNRLIIRGSAGTTWVGDFHRLPPELRFFAGGDQSNRGYGYEALGPKNSYNRVIGGRNLLNAGVTVEHYFTPHWGMAAFVDAGNAFNGSHINPRIGSGLGLRYRSPIGMVRLDFGVPVNDPNKHGVQLNLYIGPDL